MTSLSVAIRIWIKTMVLGCIVFGVCISFATMDGVTGLLAAFFFLLIGVMVTLPLLMFISPMVQLSARLPYDKRSRMGWLVFGLFILYFLAYMLAEFIVSGRFIDFGSRGVTVLMIITFADLFIAVVTTHKSLYKLYEQP